MFLAFETEPQVEEPSSVEEKAVNGESQGGCLAGTEPSIPPEMALSRFPSKNQILSLKR